MSEFKKVLRSERMKKKWSQASLSKASGVNGAVISRLESGKMESPTVQTIAKIWKALGLPSQWIIDFFGKD